jgi:hypothetical protein
VTIASPRALPILNLGWFAKFDRCGVYAARSERDARTIRKTVFLHKVLRPVPAGFKTDHISRNRLDNRDENLRPATPSQNAINRPGKRQGPRGVRKVSRNCWAARITVSRKVIRLGYYATEEIAAAAYDRAAMTLHGEFASLNGGQS